jgi:phage repressor protein C with HTH and peptisase S24 domain
MNWLQYISDLKAGKTVQCRPKGNSMRPKILNGQLITISPDTDTVGKGDIVFCKVNGHFYVHLVTAVQGDRYQISNNKGHVNGWIGKKAMYGKVIRIEP